MRRPLLSFVAVVAVVALLACGCSAARRGGPPMRFDHPKGAAVTPLAVYIHGGGWNAGDKLSDGYYKTVRARLLAQGVAVASLDYRLAPKYPFPSMIVDVSYAVRYLRSNAKRLHIDPDRIAAFGTSAGGHLASLLGTMDKSAGFDVGALTDVSSRVKAVVDIVGPVDLTDPAIPPITDAGIQEAFGVVGGKKGDPTLAKASPVTYISRDDPPFLIVHGTNDELVPFNQSVAFNQRLKAAGVRSELLQVTGGTHALATPGQSVAPAQITELVAAFLVSELRR